MVLFKVPDGRQSTMGKETRLEIITLGDELLLGIRPNTHLSYLGKHLSRKGLSIQRNLVIRDDQDEITRYFHDAWSSADVIITTGGLGSTHDDITRETIALALGLELIHNEEVERAIRERFRCMDRPVTEATLRQAKVIEGAEVIPNHFGTAPGMWLERNGKILIMLPGPSLELYPMFEERVLPMLTDRGFLKSQDAFFQVRSCGVGESLLESRLTPIFERYRDRLAVSFCAHDGLVDLRLQPGPAAELSWSELEEVGRECREILNDDFVTYGDETPAELLLGHLRALGRTLAVGEACTGGLLGSAFTDVPGASEVFAGGVVCYNNSAKVEMLGVPDAILQQHGAISAECAAAMAMGAAERFSADHALSVTGIAGPGGGSPEHPVGTIFMGSLSPAGVWSRKVVYPGNRKAVRMRAVAAAMDWMRRELKKHEVDDVLASMVL